MEKALVFFNSDVEGLYLLLTQQKITSGKQSRMRTRFCNILEQRLKEIEGSRNDIMKLFCEKDENGELKPLDDSEDGKVYYRISPELVSLFDQEISILMSERLVIDITESSKEMIEVVGNFILNAEFEGGLNGKLAKDYDRWCEIFEGCN